jgi:hypothetical protein
MTDEVFVEKCCSRCDRISWDSMVGKYTDPCGKKGISGALLRCDTDGRRMETDNTGHVEQFDKDGNNITTPDTNEES